MDNKDVKRSKTGFLSFKNEADARDSTEASLEITQGGTIKNNPTSEHRALPTVPTKHHSKQSALASPTSSPSMASGSKTGVNAEDTKDIKKNNAPLSVADSSGASGDCHIGLKLGKRTYFEDRNGGGAVRPPSQVAVSPAQSKKSRAMAQATQTPRCQVEGCNKDLTSSKDYHRRHKVCEVHSKTAKVSVAGKEQRFCQQCSRFHELIEFDEGKRSCRRRLAGHNERRRKPQPDPTTINAARIPPSFYDIRHGNYLEKSLFLHPSISSSSLLGDPCDFKLGHGQRTYPRFIKTEDQSTYNGNLQVQSIDQDSYSSSDRLLLFLQNSKTVSGNALNQGYPQYILSSGSPLGQALTLSSSQGTGVIAPPLQNLSGVSDSGRALSLLSPPSWAPRTSISVSLNMATRSGASLDQLVHNQPPMAQPLVEGLQHNYDYIEDKLLSISPQSTTSIVSGGFPLSGGTSINKEQHHGEVTTNTGDIGNFGSQMPGLQQQPGIRDSQGLSPKDIRCTIELLRKSSGGQAHESQAVRKMGNPGSGQLTEFDPVKSSYETSMYYSQQMM